MSDHERFEGVTCPGCGTLNDCAHPVGHDGRPEIGSAMLCVDCTTVLVIEEGWTARRATDEEVHQMKEQNPEFGVYYHGLRLMHMMNRGASWEAPK